MLIDILTLDNQAYGCIFLDSKTNKISIYLSSYIILATGGAGQLYLHTTNPLIATGDGIVSAFRAGARIMDLEFFPVSPNSLKNRCSTKIPYLRSSKRRRRKTYKLLWREVYA